MVSFFDKLAKTLTDKAKKIKDKAIELLPISDTEVSYEALYSKNRIKKKDCKWYINCENARKLKFIISDYLSDIRNKSIIDGMEDTEAANLDKYKVEVIDDNADHGIIKIINNNTNNFLNLNINNLCIKSDKEYENCKKYLDYEPVFYTYKNKKLYTGLYKEFINEPIDNNICKVLITCKNAIKLAKEIKQINDEKVIYTSDTLKKIEIKVYSVYSLIKLGAKIESIDPKNLSFNIKYDDETTSIINNGSKFNFVSLCITDDTYTKYNECGEINSLGLVEHKTPKEEDQPAVVPVKLTPKTSTPPKISTPLTVHIPEPPPIGPPIGSIPTAPPLGPIPTAPPLTMHISDKPSKAPPKYPKQPDDFLAAIKGKTALKRVEPEKKEVIIHMPSTDPAQFTIPVFDSEKQKQIDALEQKIEEEKKRKQLKLKKYGDVEQTEWVIPETSATQVEATRLKGIEIQKQKEAKAKKEEDEAEIKRERIAAKLKEDEEKDPEKVAKEKKEKDEADAKIKEEAKAALARERQLHHEDSKSSESSMSSGGYLRKYLKYKSKYLKMKNK